MFTTASLVETPVAWHLQGLFMSMHWGWWAVIIATGLLMLWAFWRLFSDRREVRREIARIRATEQALRERYARGEIDPDQLIQGLRALSAPRASAAGYPRRED